MWTILRFDVDKLKVHSRERLRNWRRPAALSSTRYMTRRCYRGPLTFHNAI